MYQSFYRESQAEHSFLLLLTSNVQAIMIKSVLYVMLGAE